jgi:hypothetical protein
MTAPGSTDDGADHTLLSWRLAMLLEWQEEAS